MSITCTNLRNIINLFVMQNNNNINHNSKFAVMETTFEKLNDQEMVNVVGGDRIVEITDKYGNVWYIIIEVDEEESDPQP